MQDRWDRCIAEFADVSYAWPDAYCCALAHRLLNGKTDYHLLEMQADTELQMLANGLRAFGSIGEGHDCILTAAGAQPINPKHIYAHTGIKIAWASDGVIDTVRGPVLIDGDTRGIMIFCPPIGDRLIWTRDGLTVVNGTHNAQITRAWRIA